jgi:hypothetical protein
MPGSNNNVQYSKGYRLELSGAQEAYLAQKAADDISILNVDGEPNGVVEANIGSIGFDSTNGDWWRKDSGTGNTGWVLANGTFTTVKGDDTVTTSPDSNGNIELSGVIVANGTNVKPLFIAQDSVDANQENWNLQLSTALASAPSDSNDAGISSFLNTQFAVDANGFVTLVGGVTPPALTITGDDSLATQPNGSGNWNFSGVAVANATHATPLFVRQDSVDANQENWDIQVSTALTGAPGDKNDAGIASFDDTDFTVDGDGFVQLVGSPTIFWQEVAINTNMAINNGYITNAAGSINLALPTTASVGDRVRLTRKGAGAFVVQQAAGQSIRFGSSITTTGGTGSITSLNVGDSLEILCITANSGWEVLSSIGAGFTIA